VASYNRWAEYEAGTLTPPAVVQRDSDTPSGWLVWVWSGAMIHGPFKYGAWDAATETATLALAVSQDPPPPDTFTITGEDGEVLTGEVPV
jgi:hypothetical protein